MQSWSGQQTTGGGAGNLVLLADAMRLAAGTLDAGTANVLLGPVTATEAINLAGGPPPAHTLDVTAADLRSVTAGILYIGCRNENGSPALTGDITIAAPTTIDTVKIPELLLVTGGAVTEGAGASIGTATGMPPLALGVIAGVRCHSTTPMRSGRSLSLSMAPATAFLTGTAALP